MDYAIKKKQKKFNIKLTFMTYLVKITKLSVYMEL